MGGRGGGGGDARRSGVATVRDDDVGGDGRDDDDSVSRGGTPVPLSDGSGATPGGGAAGSEASETSERAGASGTRDRETRRRATAMAARAAAVSITRPVTGRGDGVPRAPSQSHDANTTRATRRDSTVVEVEVIPYY